MTESARTASQAYLEVAAAHGVDYVFGLPGTSGQEFIGTIADQEKVRFILALHETCVVSMADGYARVTGRPSLAQTSFDLRGRSVLRLHPRADCAGVAEKQDTWPAMPRFLHDAIARHRDPQVRESQRPRKRCAVRKRHRCWYREES